MKIANHMLATVLAVAMSMTGLLAINAATADPAVSAAKGPDFETLKKLVGEWQVEAADKSEMNGTIKYQMTSGNSALLETMFPGTPQEMVDVYTRDKNQLVMTHYCAMGNQPHLRAKPTQGANALKFDFVSAGNLPSVKSPHMHSLKITFEDDNHIKQEWQSYADGKPSGITVFKLTRKS
jgi:hypothetical protein